MPKQLVKAGEVKPIVIGHFTLHATGMDVWGRPSFEEYQGVGDFIQRAHRACGFWLGDWLRYGERRAEWQERLSQAHTFTGLSEKTLKNVRAVARSIDVSRRRDDVEFDVHAEVAGLEPEEQVEWLGKCEKHGWGRRELRLNLIAHKRRRVLHGQATLEGQYRVLYADPPWIYGNRPPSGSGAQEHYDGMTIEALCELPIRAHTAANAVLFLWVTAPMLYENPGPREVIEAWGFTPKTGIVWDKVRHNFGNYVSVRHEHLLIATRGACTPDRPTPMPDSVITERPDGEHSAKPASFRTLIESLYDGPRLELFARERVDGWAAFGNDARLWTAEAVEA